MKKSNFGRLEYQKKRTDIINSAIEDYRIRYNLRDKAEAIFELSNDIECSEDEIKNSIYRKKSLTSKFVNDLEIGLNLEKGTLSLIYDDLENVHPVIEVRRSIERFFYTLDPLDAFYLLKTFDVIILIRYQVFDALVAFNELDNSKRALFLKKLFETRTTMSISKWLIESNRISHLVEFYRKDSSEIKEDFNKIYESPKIQRNNNKNASMINYIWKQLRPKIDKLDYYNLDKFYEMSRCIYTMDRLDWNVVIGLEMLDTKEINGLFE